MNGTYMIILDVTED